MYHYFCIISLQSAEAEVRVIHLYDNLRPLNYINHRTFYINHRTFFPFLVEKGNLKGTVGVHVLCFCSPRTCSGKLVL